jgi:hypothetical protein
MTQKQQNVLFSCQLSTLIKRLTKVENDPVIQEICLQEIFQRIVSKLFKIACHLIKIIIKNEYVVVYCKICHYKVEFQLYLMR